MMMYRVEVPDSVMVDLLRGPLKPASDHIFAWDDTHGEHYFDLDAMRTAQASGLIVGISTTGQWFLMNGIGGRIGYVIELVEVDCLGVRQS